MFKELELIHKRRIYGIKLQIDRTNIKLKNKEKEGKVT